LIRHSDFVIRVSLYMPWSNDDLDDREFPDEEFDDDEDETVTRECPRCGVDVYEDAEQCPLCGAWISWDNRPWTGRSWWWVALGLAGVVALIWALTVGL
jgi:hypothetical protein